MDIPFVEKTSNDDMQKYLSIRKKYTVNTIDSLPEFDNKLYLSKIIIIMSFLSLILGLYILLNNSFYFNAKYNFSYSSILYYYILIYTLGLIGIFILSFCITLFIKLISSIKKCFEQNSKDNNDILKEKEILLDDNYNSILSNELENSDNIATIPYTLSICIFLGIILYLIGFPFSFYLIYILFQNNYYYKISEFVGLYLFILINDISGGIFLFVLISFIRNKTQNSLRIMSFAYDEDNLMNAYKEVKDAINLAK
jgi:hypothetical protein